MKQCYGGPYSHFIGPQWYFIDAWNNVSVQPKQAIWKPRRNQFFSKMLGRTAVMANAAFSKGYMEYTFHLYLQEHPWID